MTNSGPSAPGPRRLQKELTEFKKNQPKAFQDLTVDDDNLYVWKGVIFPDNPPYRGGAFKVEILFPPEYPFRPPKIVLKTKIYHPNFDEKGQVCLGLLTPENWKPSISVLQVVYAFLGLLDEPDPTDALRSDIGNELANDREKFMKNADMYTKKYSEK